MKRFLKYSALLASLFLMSGGLQALNAESPSQDSSSTAVSTTTTYHSESHTASSGLPVSHSDSADLISTIRQSLRTQGESAGPIEILVADKTVTLRGPVANLDEKRQIEKQTKSLIGGRILESQLQVSTKVSSDNADNAARAMLKR